MKPIQWVPTVIILTAMFLQSTILKGISIGGASFDLVVILIVFFSNRFGSMHGQLSGFLTGIIEDFLSLSPLGFYTFIRTLTGYLFGITKGKIFLDALLAPVVLVVIASIVKIILANILALFFSLQSTVPGLFSGVAWIEIGLNAFLSPFIFGILKMVKMFRYREINR